MGMGHGNPVTYELLTGGSNLELMVAGTNALRGLIESHQNFVFVASEPRDRLLQTIGQALHPMEFAIVRTLDEELQDWLHQRRFAVNVGCELVWDAESIPATEWIPRFIKRVASKVVVGVFRASHLAPVQKFYAHEDHADLAAHIVLADSMLQEHRGFPMLVDMARRVCHTEFGETLEELAETAYAAAGLLGDIPVKKLTAIIEGRKHESISKEWDRFSSRRSLLGRCAPAISCESRRATQR